MTKNVCTQCGYEHVVIHRKYNGQRLCSSCFKKSIEGKVLKTIKKQKLVTKGDKVLVGLSGGKDSVALLKILNILKEKRIIELEAVTIDEGIAGYREEGVRIAKNRCQDKRDDHKRVINDRKAKDQQLADVEDIREQCHMGELFGGTAFSEDHHSKQKAYDAAGSADIHKGV